MLNRKGSATSKRIRNYPFSRHTTFVKTAESPGKLTFQNDNEPSQAGICWLAAPRDCIGLVYRVTNESVIEALEIVGDTITVVDQVQVYVPIINITCSDDGRLIVAACCDGSLACFDVMPGYGIQPRWSTADVHSHETPTLAEPPSKDRTFAAVAAGPIHSFSFAFSEYYFLLVDGGAKQIQIYDAAMQEAIDLLTMSGTGPTTPKTFNSNDTTSTYGLSAGVKPVCASWFPAEWEKSEQDHAIPLVLGMADGTVAVSVFSKASSRLHVLKIIEMPSYLQSKPLPYVCTHVDWCNDGKTLAVGYATIRSGPRGKEIQDTEMFVTSVSSKLDLVGWIHTPQVVPSATALPATGRHVFTTSFVQTQKQYVCLVVVSNLCHRPTLLRDDGRSGWKVANVRQKRTAKWEPAFPVGALVTPVPRDHETMDVLDQCFLIITTKGKLIKYNLEHQKLQNLFTLGDNITLVPVDQAVGGRTAKRRLSFMRSKGMRKIKAPGGIGIARTGSSDESIDEWSSASISEDSQSYASSTPDDESTIGIEIDSRGPDDIQSDHEAEGLDENDDNDNGDDKPYTLDSHMEIPSDEIGSLFGNELTPLNEVDVEQDTTPDPTDADGHDDNDGNDKDRKDGPTKPSLTVDSQTDLPKELSDAIGAAFESTPQPQPAAASSNQGRPDTVPTLWLISI